LELGGIQYLLGRHFNRLHGCKSLISEGNQNYQINHLMAIIMLNVINL